MGNTQADEQPDDDYWRQRRKIEAARERQSHDERTSSRLTVATFFADVGASRTQEKALEWADLVAKIKKPLRYPAKATMPLIKLARFGEVRTDKGSLRHDANAMKKNTRVPSLRLNGASLRKPSPRAWRLSRSTATSTVVAALWFA